MRVLAEIKPMSSKPAQRGTPRAPVWIAVAMTLYACSSAREAPQESGADGGVGGWGGSEAGSGGVGGIGGMSQGGLGGVGAAGGGCAQSGDSGAESDACKQLERARAITCLVGEWSDADAGVMGTDPIREADIHGTVVSTEAVGCTGVGGGYANEIGRGLKVAGEEGGFTFGFVGPWADAMFEVGDTLQVSYRREPVPWLSEGWPPTGSVVIRDADGQLLYWIAETYRGFADLTVPPELELENGATSCTYAPSNSSSVRMSLRATAGGESVEVPYGETANAGDFVFLHIANDAHRTSYPAGCSQDAHEIRVAAVRRSLIQ